MGLRRAGLPTDVPSYTTAARDQLNMGLKDLVNRREWRFRFKDGTITTTATVRTYSLAADVLRPLRNSWRHTTDDAMMIVRDYAETDPADPDEDMTGGSRIVVYRGINSSTGYWEVDLIDTPDTSSETISYRYISKASELADDATDDGTDLDLTYPDWVQNAMTLWVSAFMKGEEGDAQGQISDKQLYEDQIIKAEMLDGSIAIPDKVSLSRSEEFETGIDFKVLSLSL